MSALAVWHVARECAGLAESGGVKDVVRGLAQACARGGLEVTVVLPRYGFLRDLPCRALGWSAPVRLCDHRPPWKRLVERVGCSEGRLGDIRVLLIESSRFADKQDVYTYTEADQERFSEQEAGTGHWDTQQMNLLLQRGALEAALREGAPGVYHCHDGHTAFLPALAAAGRRRSRRGAVITIHNAGPGYRQEVWGLRYARRLTRLSRRTLEQAVVGPAVEPLVAGARHAAINTVSPWYAEDIRREPLGEALTRQGSRLLGITNGVDVDRLDPRRDQDGLAASFDPSTGDLRGKQVCRRDLLRRLGTGEVGSARVSGRLESPEELPLVAYVGRLTVQKGIDTLCDALEDPAFPRCAVVVLGEGMAEYKQRLAALAEGKRRGEMILVAGFEPDLAGRIYAGADFLVVPSQYEPCGIIDLQAQLLGTVPVVHAVGGLNKIRDGVTGVSYRSPETLTQALRRAVDLGPDARRELQRRAFRSVVDHYTWDRVFEEHYLPLYRQTAGGDG